MPSTVLFEANGHKNIMLEDFGHGEMVQANQHLIIHEDSGMLLDPGGHKVYAAARGECMSLLQGGTLDHLFFSHQDPDIVAAANGWLMTTDARAHVSSLWTRFVPHFGIDEVFTERLTPIPDEGRVLDLKGVPIHFVPAHFLHSCGNFQVYDSTSKILYTGDLGASLGQDYLEVQDFDKHIEYMSGFHRRYMTSNSTMRAWAEMARTIDIDIIAPQHGAIFRGKDMVTKFIDWCSGLECGVDVMLGLFKLPQA